VSAKTATAAAVNHRVAGFMSRGNVPKGRCSGKRKVRLARRKTGWQRGGVCYDPPPWVFKERSFLAILKAGIGLPARAVCVSWEFVDELKQNLPSRRQPSLRLFSSQARFLRRK